MSVDEYLKKFSRLNTDKSRQRWSAATCHRAPHKPFLMLSIMDLITQGFRRAIVSLYDHRCALCGIRMRMPEGHTVVEAAHIVPWSESHDDLPSNGLCLCRLCHWSFDEGLIGVGSKYEVLVSQRVRIDSNIPGHIFTLADRPIFKPDAERYWPGQENLGVHRKQWFP